MRHAKLLSVGLLLAFLFALAPHAEACGGFFCTNVPVDQAAERINFAVNDDGTMDAYVQINYQGAPDAFAWAVPVPNPPKVDVVPMTVITELDNLTKPVYKGPAWRNDCRMPTFAATSAPAGAPKSDSVTVFGQGQVGPFDYAIIGSDDTKAMVNWLRTNKYQITPAMEPFIDVYVKEQMVFLAMKLQPNKQVRDIQPVKMTYMSAKPMIPLRLTAVAATPNMVVLTWILAKSQAVPENYAVVKVPDDEIEFYPFGSNTYTQLAQQRLSQYRGRAFITEYAGAANRFSVNEPVLRALLSSYPYLTRVYTRISPADMTIDPVFKFDSLQPDVSNVHDLSQDPRRGWDCNTLTNRVGAVTTTNNPSPTTSPVVAPAASQSDANTNALTLAIYLVGGCITLALAFVGFGLIVGRRRA